ncbi:MAG: class I SAM-dependent methyltransferase [Chloroflexota bacterium]
MEYPEYERMYQLEDWHWWFVSRRRMATALLEQWLEPGSPGRVLDVGCGTGGNLAALARWGPVSGLDLSPLPLNFAQHRLAGRLAQASALALPYPDATFYLVTAFDMLYHQWITDDDRAIHEIYRVLKPGGWLLVTDSAMPLLWSAHDEIYYARERYTLPKMRAKLSQVGFTPRRCSYTNFLLLPAAMTVRLMMRWFSFVRETELQALPEWFNGLLLAIRELEVRWLRRNRTLPAGSSLICLAQKLPTYSKGHFHETS